MARKQQELAWVAAGQALTLGIGFLSIKILTGMMGVAAYGQLMLGVSIAALISLFIYGPLGQAATRFYSVCRARGDLGGYIQAFRTIHTRLLKALMLPAFAVAAASSLVIEGIWPYLVAAAILYAAVSGINHGFISMFGGMRRRAVVAVHQAAESAARLSGAVLMMLLAGISPAAALVGYGAGSLLVLGSLSRVAGTSNGLVHVQQLPPPASGNANTEEQALYEEIRRYVLPFLVWAAIGYAFLHGDRWMLQGVRGPEAVGAYVAIYQIGSALPNALIAIISQYLEPLVFERFEAADNAERQRDGMALIRKATLYIGLFLTLIVSLAATWSAEITGFVTTPEFTRHAGLLAWIVAATGLIGLGQILTIQGLAMRRPSAYIGPKAVAAGVLLGAAFFGATQRGAEGVAMALTAAGTVYLVSVLAVNTRLSRYEPS
ncbi:MAG TPA: hypothetical protein ENK49_14490 [Gammaproteobacteria bacterium]|nr:hypothetical protein [Gammaproteobacteria bacterium]